MSNQNKLENIKDIYGAHWRDLCNYVRGRFGSGPPDPEDVAQATFLKFADQKHVENPKAFLFTSARNMVVDYHRSPKNYQPTQEQIDDHEKKRDGSDVFDPENVYLSKEEINIVESVLMQLSERDRAFVLMNRLDGLTYTEIAKRANMSRSGVQKVITLALEKCMDALSDKDLVGTRTAL